MKEAMSMGLISYTEAIAMGGRDPEVVKAQIIEDQEFIANNNLSLTTYPSVQQVSVATSEPDLDDEQDQKDDDEPST